MDAAGRQLRHGLIINRLLAERGVGNRAILPSNQAMTRTAQSANDDMDEFIHAVRQAISEVKDSLTDAITPAKLNRFVEDWIGPIRVDADGSLHPLSLE